MLTRRTEKGFWPSSSFATRLDRLEPRRAALRHAMPRKVFKLKLRFPATRDARLWNSFQMARRPLTTRQHATSGARAPTSTSSCAQGLPRLRTLDAGGPVLVVRRPSAVLRQAGINPVLGAVTHAPRGLLALGLSPGRGSGGVFVRPGGVVTAPHSICSRGGGSETPASRAAP